MKLLIYFFSDTLHEYSGICIYLLGEVALRGLFRVAYHYLIDQRSCLYNAGKFCKLFHKIRNNSIKYVIRNYLKFPNDIDA